MSSLDAIILVECLNVSQYESVRSVVGFESSKILPVFANGKVSLAGLPPNTKSISFQAWLHRKENTGAVRNPAPSKQTGRICISVAEPHCQAISSFLCEMTGKELELCANSQQWDDAITRRVNDPTTRSMSLILPLWTPGDSGWLTRLIKLMRDLDRSARVPPWGVLTGPSPTVLSLLAAKSILQNEIIEAYRAHCVAVFKTPGTSSIEPRSQASSSSIQIFSSGRFQESEFERRAWSALIFLGHGRSYCACDGHLCGARTLETDPHSTIKSCVLNLACADSSYPQIDPRVYDAPLMVLDTCGAANLASSTWDAGIPPLAFLAVSGAPGSVIVSDVLTQDVANGHVDILWALRSGATVGETTLLFNKTRTYGNISVPYFLLGDPDGPCGKTRWPELAATAEAQVVDGQKWEVSISASEAPFLRFLVPSIDKEKTGQPQTLYVTAEESQAQVLNAWIFAVRKRRSG